MLLAQVSEFGLINRIKELTQKHQPQNVIVGIDDDAAAIRIIDNEILLLTTDTMIEGVHFDLSYFTCFQLGQKIMAVNISDIAAMGGRPSYVLIALSIPPTVPLKSVEELYQGIIRIGDRYDISIIGGDTTSTPQNIFISITLVGYTNPEKLTLRSGAKEGDVVCVTGFLGMSKAGLKVLRDEELVKQDKFEKLISKHLTPEPRLHEAQFLVQNGNIHSMIDVSDGLLADLDHICKLSNVGAEIFSETIPVEESTKRVAHHFDDSWLNYAISGGEDFELLITMPENDYNKIVHDFEKILRLNLTKIGRIVKKDKGVKVFDKGGKVIPINSRGYDHFNN